MVRMCKRNMEDDKLVTAVEQFDTAYVGRLMRSSSFSLTPGVNPVVRSILEKRWYKPLEDRASAVHIACYIGAADILELFLEKAPDCHRVRTTEKGLTPAHALCLGCAHPQKESDFEKCLSILEARGADLKDRDNTGNTILHALARAQEDASSDMGASGTATPEDADESLYASVTEFSSPDGIQSALKRLAQTRENTPGRVLVACASPLGMGGMRELGQVHNDDGLLAADMISTTRASPARLLFSDIVRGGRDGAFSVNTAEADASASILESLRTLQLSPEQKTIKEEGAHLVAVKKEEPRVDNAFEGHGERKVLLIYDDVCLEHDTTDECQEKKQRLVVLCGSDGVLRRPSFENLAWSNINGPAYMADILRVHESGYVRALQSISSKAAEEGKIKFLPWEEFNDTRISAGSWKAASYAAGAVCQAVDSVLRGEYESSFVATRPPGHHAGPAGLVTGSTSQGFCLLNNVAIGAAYAMNRWRDEVKRVAIVDFDVHHGDGTEECVRSVVPRTSETKLGTCTPSLAEQTIRKTVHKPWLSDDDSDNIRFVSMHVFGDIAQNGKSTVPFYPGTGASSNVSAVSSANDKAILNAGLPPSPVRKGSGSPTKVNRSKASGEQSKAAMYERWSEIIANLEEFDPDLLFISAGFDAHIEDALGNYGFMNWDESDYRRLTDDLVAVADRCCRGRIVSVLEGGYKVDIPAPAGRGGTRRAKQNATMYRSPSDSNISICALARSVGTHVLSLMRSTNSL